MIDDFIAAAVERLEPENRLLWERYRVPMSRIGGSTNEFYELARKPGFVLFYDDVENLFGVTQEDRVDSGEYWDRTELGHGLFLLDAAGVWPFI